MLKKSADQTGLDASRKDARLRFKEALGRPSGSKSDWTIPQDWDRYDSEEHSVWDMLFEQQLGLLSGRAVSAFESSINRLNLCQPGIPRLETLNSVLNAQTGWHCVAVEGLVPDDVFFAHLSKRRFPVGRAIRSAEQMHFIEVPDLFHDIFGHVVMLADTHMADFMQEIGRLGLSAMAAGALSIFTRLYWYTVEVGLANEGGKPRLFGAALLSSFEECLRAMNEAESMQRSFDLPTVLRTDYKPYDVQACYFTIESFAQLVDTVRSTDFSAHYAELTKPDRLAPPQVPPSEGRNC